MRSTIGVLLAVLISPLAQAELIDDAGLQSQYAEFADAVRFLADLTAEKR